MSAVRELTVLLIKAGVDPVEATILIARAGLEMAPPADTRTPGARRQAAWRERHKTSHTVTKETPDDASQSVTNRYETSQSNAPSLSKEEKIESKKLKRESARAGQMPDGWRPDAVSWGETTILLGGEDRAEYELKKFRDHALEKGRTAKNWNAAWRNWAKRSVEFGGRNGYRTGSIHPNSPAQQSGSTAIFAGVAAATERRARERSAAGQQRPASGDDNTPGKSDPQLYGAG